VKRRKHKGGPWLGILLSRHFSSTIIVR
jgi:hypothetical protein